MNVLIDTNILIPLEDTTRKLDPAFAEMCRLSEQNGHVLFIHPSQVEDVNRDRNQERRDIVLSRLKQYQTIPAPPHLSDEVLTQYGWRQTSENDRIDNLLLHALCRGAVHFLVSNDKNIHQKARAVGVQEQVHRLDQFLVFLKTRTEAQQQPPFGIHESFLHEFSVQQAFFDSLREGYNGFDEWYLRSAGYHRKAWCVNNNGIVQAICIYKEEDRPVIVDRGTPLDGIALKLCTFKVGEDVRGRKLGERLLFTAFKYADEQGIPYIYLHTFGKEHELLVQLCKDYGFEFAGKYDNRDDVYLKKMVAPNVLPDNMSPLSFAITYYPHYLDDEKIGKFIVPIKPGYHNDLFADISDTASGLFANDPTQYNPQSNTIKKAYVCHANTNQIRPGDILLFYRTGDRQSIECLGIAEMTYRGNNIDKVIPMVSKRTVYSKKEVEEWLLEETLVILFRLIRIVKPIERRRIENAGILGQIQSIRKITHEQYLRCFAEGRIE